MPEMNFYQNDEAGRAALPKSGEQEAKAPQSPTPWMIRPLADMRTGRPCGVLVYRVHNPCTDRATVEHLQPRARFSSAALARAAIAAA